ncbi:NAD(P)H-binding protein [Actinocrispum sp. NPDC049592]|uniref:NAD(P)H-binding protein n=1 Tax=Actinocrispum sp. NPDC049592 TaxID=3154835 RepID=UPI00344796A7
MMLITGATGNVGRPLVEALVQQGAEVRAMTRDLAPGFPPEVQLSGDLHGVTSVFLNSRPLGSLMSQFVAQAVAAGVRRIVALSAINADDEVQPSRFRGDLNREAELLATESGVEWVSLRPTMFACNALGMWAGQIRDGDVVRGPYAEATWAPVDERDVAAVAAHALLTDDLLGRKVDLTGPMSLTQAESIAMMGATLGRSLRYKEVPAEAFAEGMVSRGFPRGFADALMSLYANSVGTPAVVTDSIPRILGRPARSFAQWTIDHKDAFQR